MDAGAAVRCGAGVDQVAVVVPLDVGDVVLAENRGHPFQDVVVRLGDPQIEHLLVPRRHRCAAAGRHDPLRMLPREVGIEVDHFRFEPQAEFHAERTHVIDDRVQTVRPHRLVDVPVPQSRQIVAPVPEPAVVEDVPLDAEFRRAIRQVLQPGQVVVEVDGLPHVDRDRARAPRVRRPRPEIVVEATCLIVEPVAVGAVDPGRLVALPVRQPDLAGQEQFAAADHLESGEETLGVVAVVAAERDVGTPHFAAAETEPGHADGKYRRGVRAGASLPSFPFVDPDGELAALRGAFLPPSAGEVEDLAGLRRDRERELEVVENVEGVARVGDLGARPKETARQQLDVEDQTEIGDRVAARRPGRRPAPTETRSASGDAGCSAPSTVSVVVVNSGDQSAPSR